MIRATPEAVFEELGDPSLWFALLHHSVWKSGATSGVNALREVQVHGFGAFRERMLAWDPGRRVAFTMIGTTSPLVARMAEDMVIEPLGDGVRFHWNVVAEPTALGRIIQPGLGGILRGLFMQSARNLAKRTRWSEGRVAATHGA
ncbi:MAG: SRPBCC family protein [Kofleriaceae bacterium]